MRLDTAADAERKVYKAIIAQKVRDLEAKIEDPKTSEGDKALYRKTLDKFKAKLETMIGITNGRPK